MNATDRISMGLRLREERQRLQFSQDELSEAGKVSKRTQAAWEKGEQTANAEYLAHVSAVGVDVLYVVTGERSMRQLQELGVLLNDDEKALLNSFRTASPTLRRSLALIAATAARGESQPDTPSPT